MKILFASHNNHKLKELQSIMPSPFVVSNLNELEDFEEIEESGTTLEENALLKARIVYNKYNCNVVADDTGLEIDALDGAPGVYSARFAGEENDSLKNMEKVLDLLKSKSNRKAQFKTVMALIIDGKEHIFEGVVKGQISEKMYGDNGFGYDPIFLPEGYSHTFAEMSLEMKNKISHRAIALNKLVEFLKK